MATTPTLNAEGNTIPNISDLANKAYYNENVFDIDAKYFIISDNNKFANDVLNGKNEKKN